MKEVKAEIKEEVGIMVKTVPLGSTLYDYAFHQLFYENNPETLFTLKLKVSLTFGVQALVIYFFFADLLTKFEKYPYFGTFAINVVRLVSAMLLHLSQMSELDRSVAMTSFLVENAN